MIQKIIFALLFAATLNTAAATRLWKSADGTRSVKGELVTRNDKAVTIRRSSDFKEVTIPLDQLFPEDLTWLNINHPLPGAAPIYPVPTLTFEPLILFGESRAQILSKVKINKEFKATIAETLMGRTGGNGVYRTMEKIGGLHASLFFGWENEKLKDFDLQTEALPASDLKERLLPCWKMFTTLLTNQYGTPIKATKQLDLAAAQGDLLHTTHMWKLKGPGIAMLGVYRKDDQYLIAAHFTTTEPQSIPALAPDKTAGTRQSP